MTQDIVGSKMTDFPADQLTPKSPKRGYGQNGFNGASSDLPGENTVSGFLPACDVNAAVTQDTPKDPNRQTRTGKGNPPAPTGKHPLSGPQARTVKADLYPLSVGMKRRGRDDGSPG